MHGLHHHIKKVTIKIMQPITTTLSISQNMDILYLTNKNKHAKTEKLKPVSVLASQLTCWFCHSRSHRLSLLSQCHTSVWWRSWKNTSDTRHLRMLYNGAANQSPKYNVSNATKRQMRKCLTYWIWIRQTHSNLILGHHLKTFVSRHAVPRVCRDMLLT